MALSIEPRLYNDNSLTLLQKALITERIATHEVGSNIYPASEAAYASIEEWERDTDRNFFQEFSVLYRASHGAY
jgi:hypothetical protein